MYMSVCCVVKDKNFKIIYFKLHITKLKYNLSNLNDFDADFTFAKQVKDCMTTKIQYHFYIKQDYVTKRRRQYFSFYFYCEI